jgi:antitoxin component YwqK of YwqJK toxin-antitoxin module
MNILLLCACSETSNTIERAHETYPNGNVKVKYIFKSTTDTTHYLAETYYETGKLKSVGSMQDSIIVGYWRYYFENGNLKQKGNYAIDDSLNNGDWTYTYKKQIRGENGNILKKFDGWMCSVEAFAREKRNLHICKTGSWTYYYENGKVKSKGSYKNGLRDGRWSEYADNGKKILSANYENGKPIKQWTYWYPNGQLMKVICQTDSTELLIEAYNQHGDKEVINGKGRFTEIDKNASNSFVITTYENGIKNGPYKKYFKGKIEEDGNYLNGNRHGLWTNYLFHFGKWIETTYNNGVRNGYVYEYSGKDTMRIQYFSNGLEHGVSKYYEYGVSHGNPKQISIVECWDMGKRHGIRERYERNGDLTELEYFYNNEYLGIEIFNKNRMAKRSISEKDKMKFKHLGSH